MCEEKHTPCNVFGGTLLAHNLICQPLAPRAAHVWSQAQQFKYSDVANIFLFLQNHQRVIMNRRATSDGIPTSVFQRDGETIKWVARGILTRKSCAKQFLQDEPHKAGVRHERDQTFQPQVSQGEIDVPPGQWETSVGTTSCAGMPPVPCFALTGVHVSEQSVPFLQYLCITADDTLPVTHILHMCSDFRLHPVDFIVCACTAVSPVWSCKTMATSTSFPPSRGTLSKPFFPFFGCRRNFQRLHVGVKGDAVAAAGTLLQIWFAT